MRGFIVGRRRGDSFLVLLKPQDFRLLDQPPDSVERMRGGQLGPIKGEEHRPKPGPSGCSVDERIFSPDVLEEPRKDHHSCVEL